MFYKITYICRLSGKRFFWNGTRFATDANKAFIWEKWDAAHKALKSIKIVTDRHNATIYFA